MTVKKMFSITLFCTLFFSLFLLLRVGGSKDLVASLAQLPGLAETKDKGAFVDLVKAIDDVYTEGKITIEVYPFARSIDNVLTGKADFHVPMMRGTTPESKLPYRFVKEKIGTVSFVIYSHSDKPITKKAIDDALAKGGKFPYKIDGVSTLGDMLGFPTSPSDSIEHSLKKVEAKRIDGALYAQEEGDITLNNLKIRTIHRVLWRNADDLIVIAKTPDADKIDKVLSEGLKELRKSGRLNQIYSKVHKPYSNWQPSKMGW